MTMQYFSLQKTFVIVALCAVTALSLIILGQAVKKSSTNVITDALDFETGNS